MASLTPLTEPGVASAEYGVVLLDGPDGIAAAMTPACAEETGRRLIEAAAIAAGQDAAPPPE